MAKDHRKELHEIRTFPSLICYLRDEMGWPIESDNFEELTYEYSPEELGIDEKNSAKIQCIKRLRPFIANQPWGVFFVKFEPKQLPVVALRRILSKVVVKKRAAADQAEQVSWSADDLLFVSNYGESNKRTISFAHFAQSGTSSELPRLKVLGWDDLDTPLHLDDVADKLTNNLAWPEDYHNQEAWRKAWRSAFTVEHREVITTAKRLSIRLAELAQSVRDRIRSVLEIESEEGPLTKLMGDFQKALIQDLDKDSFADMYAQTIAYGLLSVRIADPKSTTAEDLTKHIHTSPFLHELMTSFMKAGGLQGKEGRSSIDFDELGVSEVIELLDNANMEAVLRDFGDRSPQDDPVIHFYESFLSHYDAESRIKRGVFYTPKPVVSFIVRSVDELLKTEFGLEDGLADVTTWGEMVNKYPDMEIPNGINKDQPFVQILDPATGTGTFLVEVIDLAYKNMVAKWDAQGHRVEKIRELWNEYVPKFLLPRLHGFELLMAPYAIAHLKIGLKLYETGYKFEKSERVRIYLTNALEPSEAKQLQLDFLPALAHEFLEVNAIKSENCFTVVIGNPPYSGISSNKGEWISNLIEDYKYIDGKHFAEKKHWLQDDYVKFIRFGQHNIQKSHSGIIAFINNHSFLDNPTFKGMRWHLINTFTKIFIFDLHGNAKKREVCSDGSADENVFDIQQGVSINLFVRTKSNSEKLANTYGFNCYGKRAYKYNLLNTVSLRDLDFLDIEYDETYYLFIHRNVDNYIEYNKGFKINDIFRKGISGIVTMGDNFVVEMNKEELSLRIESFKKNQVEENQLKQQFKLGKNYAKWIISNKDVSIFDKSKLLKYGYRPFDERWTYFDKYFIWRTRLNVMYNFIEASNIGLIIGRQGQVVGNMPWNLVLITNTIVDFNIFYRGGGMVFPLYNYPLENNILKGIGIADCTPNLNMSIVKGIADIINQKYTIEHVDIEDIFAPIDIVDYIYAVLHCPTYREKYKEFLKIDFPRIPYPNDNDTFWKLVELGGQLRQIHLLESPIVEDYITAYPAEGGNQVEKINYEDLKVKINIEQYFDGVPEIAWEFYIGGYQPAQKWLKDRKGRVLDEDDINHYQKIIKALVETDRIMKEIDLVIGDKI